MTHLKNTLHNFVERMRKTAIYAIAPLYGFWLTINKAIAEKDTIQMIANFFVSILSLPILITLTTLTFPLGMFAAICQVVILPFQCLIAKLRDASSKQEQEESRTPVSTQMSGLNFEGTRQVQLPSELMADSTLYSQPPFTSNQKPHARACCHF